MFGFKLRNKTDRFGKLILFTELLRHILYGGEKLILLVNIFWFVHQAGTLNRKNPDLNRVKDGTI